MKKTENIKCQDHAENDEVLRLIEEEHNNVGLEAIFRKRRHKMGHILRQNSLIIGIKKNVQRKENKRKTNAVF